MQWGGGCSADAAERSIAGLTHTDSVTGAVRHCATACETVTLRHPADAAVTGLRLDAQARDVGHGMAILATFMHSGGSPRGRGKHKTVIFGVIVAALVRRAAHAHAAWACPYSPYRARSSALVLRLLASSTARAMPS